MRLVKIGLASVNTTVGATHANVERALRFAKEMAAADVTVAVYPEQMIGGYPPEAALALRHEVLPVERKRKHRKVRSADQLEYIEQHDFGSQMARQRNGIGECLFRFRRKIDRNENGFDDEATAASVASRRYSGCAAPSEGRSP